jgi:hypothetical protein
MSVLNLKLDTSNIEKIGEDFDSRQQLINTAWSNLAYHFINKGKRIRFTYWPGDVGEEIVGYSGYGITKMMNSAPYFQLDKKGDDLLLLTVDLNAEVKEFIKKSMIEKHEHLTPFFHFDVVNNDGKSIFTSQDHGGITMVFCTAEEFSEITSGLVDTKLLIKLP